MSGELGLDLRRDRGVVVLVVSGELDLYSAPRLSQRGPELVDAGLADAGLSDAPGLGPDTAQYASAPEPARDGSAVVVLDLSEVPFVDSAGMGSIVTVLRQARRRGAHLSLAGVNHHLGQMLHLMGLTSILTMYPTAEDAVDSAVRGEPGLTGGDVS